MKLQPECCLWKSDRIPFPLVRPLESLRKKFLLARCRIRLGESGSWSTMTSAFLIFHFLLFIDGHSIPVEQHISLILGLPSFYNSGLYWFLLLTDRDWTLNIQVMRSMCYGFLSILNWPRTNVINKFRTQIKSRAIVQLQPHNNNFRCFLINFFYQIVGVVGSVGPVGPPGLLSVGPNGQRPQPRSVHRQLTLSGQEIGHSRFQTYFLKINWRRCQRTQNQEVVRSNPGAKI